MKTKSLKVIAAGIFCLVISAQYALAEDDAKQGSFMDVVKKKRQEKADSASEPEAEAKPKPEKKSKKHHESIPTTVRDNQPHTPSEHPKEVDSESVFTRTWRGVRTTLAEKGVQIELIYKGEGNKVIEGGLKRKTVYYGNVDFKTMVDMERLAGWKGGTVFAYVLGNHGKKPTPNVGDAQVTSNIEAQAESVRLYEAWVQQAFLGEKASVLAGLHDLNSEFQVTESSTMFINSSFGTGRDLAQSGRNGPSIFPVTSAAVRLKAEPTKNFYLQTAVFDAVPGDPANPRGTHVKFDEDDGILMITEAALVRGREEMSTDLYGKVGMGIWSYTKTFNHLYKLDAGGAPLKATSHGMYFLAEQTVLEPLALFVRYGIANSDVNRFKSNLAYGVVATGLIPTRDKDQLGIAMTTATNGPEYLTTQENLGIKAAESESTLEVTYKLNVMHGIVLQPDFQYVMNPNTDPTIKNAMVGIARVIVSL